MQNKVSTETACIVRDVKDIENAWARGQTFTLRDVSHLYLKFLIPGGVLGVLAFFHIVALILFFIFGILMILIGIGFFYDERIRELNISPEGISIRVKKGREFSTKCDAKWVQVQELEDYCRWRRNSRGAQTHNDPISGDDPIPTLQLFFQHRGTGASADWVIAFRLTSNLNMPEFNLTNASHVQFCPLNPGAGWEFLISFLIHHYFRKAKEGSSSQTLAVKNISSPLLSQANWFPVSEETKQNSSALKVALWLALKEYKMGAFANPPLRSSGEIQSYCESNRPFVFESRVKTEKIRFTTLSLLWVMALAISFPLGFILRNEWIPVIMICVCGMTDPLEIFCVIEARHARWLGYWAINSSGIMWDVKRGYYVKWHDEWEHFIRVDEIVCVTTPDGKKTITNENCTKTYPEVVALIGNSHVKSWTFNIHGLGKLKTKINLYAMIARDFPVTEPIFLMAELFHAYFHNSQT